MVPSVSVMHAMNERTIEIRWVTGPTERDHYWAKINLSTARQNEKNLKAVIKQIEQTQAPLTMKCYVIHFCDQSFCYQREWDLY